MEVHGTKLISLSEGLFNELCLFTLVDRPALSVCQWCDVSGPTGSPVVEAVSPICHCLSPGQQHPDLTSKYGIT